MSRPRMSLEGIFGTHGRCEDLQGVTQDRVLAELLTQLGGRLSLPEATLESIRRAMLTREREATTGIGNGVAIPHMKDCAFVDELVGVFGRCREGVDYGATDGEFVHVFFMLLTPPGWEDEHVQVMRRIVTMSRDRKTMQYLIASPGLDNWIEILREADDQVA